VGEDFSKGKRGPIVKSDPGKIRIAIRLDADIIEHFKNIVRGTKCGSYQTLINDALENIHKLMIKGWKRHFESNPGGTQKAEQDAWMSGLSFSEGAHSSTRISQLIALATKQ